jgi:hypothetical protein
VEGWCWRLTVMEILPPPQNSIGGSKNTWGGCVHKEKIAYPPRMYKERIRPSFLIVRYLLGWLDPLLPEVQRHFLDDIDTFSLLSRQFTTSVKCQRCISIPIPSIFPSLRFSGTPWYPCSIPFTPFQVCHSIGHMTCQAREWTQPGHNILRWICWGKRLGGRRPL